MGIDYQEAVVVLFVWEGNRRFGIALALRCRLCGISTYWISGVMEEDEHHGLRKGYEYPAYALITEYSGYDRCQQRT